MKILVYGINYYPELTGTGKYTGEMVSWLAQQGHDIRVVTAIPYYPEWKAHKPYKAWSFNFEASENVKIYRCPLYIPKKLTTLKRLIHLFSFALSSFFPIVFQLLWRPKLILCIAPTLFCMPNALFIAWVLKSKIVLHIQDFEVDAMLGLGLAKSGFFASLASSYERFCLQSVDYISTISYSMMLKLAKKGVRNEKIIFFPNWSEIERFSNVSMQQVEEMKESLNLPVNKKIILYSGNIGEKQGLEIAIDVAEKLINFDFIFVIVGQGAGKQKLENLVKKKKLTNVIFHSLQPYELLPALLKSADCHLVIQRRGAADSVLPSKLTNILAVGGNSVITAEPQTELGQLCNKYPGIAILVEPESIDSLSDGIFLALKMPPINVIAITYAQKYLQKNVIIETFLESIKI